MTMKSARNYLAPLSSTAAKLFSGTKQKERSRVSLASREIRKLENAGKCAGANIFFGSNRKSGQANFLETFFKARSYTRASKIEEEIET